MTTQRAQRSKWRRRATWIAAGGACAVALWATPTRAVDNKPGQERTAPIPPPSPDEITPEIRAAIDRGLEYLAKTQSRDGSWRSRGYGGAYPTAITSLAGLALLASGSTPTEGPYARNVSSALTYVLGGARRDGLIARPEEESHCMHGHGFAMLFLAECYGMEENPARQARIRLALQRAVELTGRSQSAAGGWLYTPDSRSDEGSVTVTQLQGLRAARNAGVAVPKRVIDNAMQYLERSANDDGGIRYRVGDGGPSRPPITAAAVVCWYNAGEYDEPLAKGALAYAERTLWPGRTEGSGHDAYAQLYLSQAVYLSGDGRWREYYRDAAQWLLQGQESDGSFAGDHVGPAYGTATSLIILQLPYNHLPILQR